MATPSHAARRFSWRALAGAIVLAGTLLTGTVSASTILAQEGAGGYLGYDTPQFYAGDSVVVSTDDGGGLSLRGEPSVSSEKVSSLQDGSVVTIVDGPEYDGSRNGWYLVSDGSTRAYAFAGFLAASSKQSESSSETSTSSSQPSGYLGYDTPQFSAGQSVVVSTDDGGSLSQRQEPRAGAEKLGSLSDGEVVKVVDGPEYDGAGNGWYLVSDGSIRAYVFAGFLAASSQSSSASAASTSSGYLGHDTPQFSAGQSVKVETDDGGGLSQRMEPRLDAEKIGSLGEGEVVSIIQGPAYDAAGNGWYLVSDGSLRAYVYGGFLVASSQSSASSTSGSTASGYLGYDTPEFLEGQRVAVSTDDGGGLSLRMEASISAEKLGSLSEGTVVTVVNGPYYDGANNGWYLVNNGSIRAFAYAGFLVASSQSTSSSSQSSGSAQFSIGDTVAPNDGTVNVRNGATTSGSLLGVLGSGDVVEITDGPFFDRNGNDWYYVVGDSVQGFVIGDFIEKAVAAASQQTGATGNFIYPLAKYTFTQGYGCSQYGFYAYNAAWGCRVHNGIDLAAPSYTPIRASDGGTVIEAGWCDCGLGYYVKIDHGNGFTTVYGHMAEMPYVRAGQSVDQGETIGPIGSTGLSTGPHTHFMVQKNGVTVNPLDYL